MRLIKVMKYFVKAAQNTTSVGDCFLGTMETLREGSVVASLFAFKQSIIFYRYTIREGTLISNDQILFSEAACNLDGLGVQVVTSNYNTKQRKFVNFVKMSIQRLKNVLYSITSAVLPMIA